MRKKAQVMTKTGARNDSEKNKTSFDRRCHSQMTYSTSYYLTNNYCTDGGTRMGTDGWCYPGWRD